MLESLKTAISRTVSINLFPCMERLEKIAGENHEAATETIQALKKKPVANGEKIMPFHLSQRSIENLKGVHPDLVAVVHKAITISDVDFCVTEGLRSIERQRSLVAVGASQTMNSRHLTGHAVDLAAWVDSGIRWDWPLYDRLAWAMKKAASDLGIKIEWGGDWVTLKDGPHFQLPWDSYPSS